MGQKSFMFSELGALLREINELEQEVDLLAK